eukprot:GHVU01009878.1.p5 GENE.GHVU01009878.1~~GHVU01009878.1.p5  ORF type:complete len:105 (+),score=2.86 GHVU01009878.1:2289-2603(+)
MKSETRRTLSVVGVFNQHSGLSRACGHRVANRIHCGLIVQPCQLACGHSDDVTRNEMKRISRGVNVRELTASARNVTGPTTPGSIVPRSELAKKGAVKVVPMPV